nr:gibberellin-regulated protein 14-like [Procambarus clarkii]
MQTALSTINIPADLLTARTIATPTIAPHVPAIDPELPTNPATPNVHQNLLLHHAMQSTEPPAPSVPDPPTQPPGPAPGTTPVDDSETSPSATPAAPPVRDITPDGDISVVESTTSNTSTPRTRTPTIPAQELPAISEAERERLKYPGSPEN